MTCSGCGKESPSYTCPRCEAKTCSVACYRAHGDGQCANALDQRTLEHALKTETVDDRAKVERMLQRTFEADRAALDEEREEMQETELLEALEALELGKEVAAELLEQFELETTQVWWEKRVRSDDPPVAPISDNLKLAVQAAHSGMAKRVLRTLWGYATAYRGFGTQRELFVTHYNSADEIDLDFDGRDVVFLVANNGVQRALQELGESLGGKREKVCEFQRAFALIRSEEIGEALKGLRVTNV
jgi:hypothetical protein